MKGLCERMKRIKSIWCFIAILLFVVMGTGCGETKQEEDLGKLKIVSTIYPSYDFAKQVGGDMVQVKMLLSPGAESHSFEPTPQNIKDIGNCDIFIYAGGENDAWVDTILESIDNPDMKIIVMTECVELLEMPANTKQDSHTDGDSAGSGHVHAYDEHVWTSPANAILIAREITNALCQLDNEHADAYMQNMKQLEDELLALDEELRAVVNQGVRKTLVFGDRFAMRYFADAYGLECYSAFLGCSGDTECSAATMATLTDTIRKEQIPVVLYMELGNGDIAQSLSEATGAKMMRFQSCHNITKEEFEAGKTYIDLMRENLEVLKEALY